MFYTDIKMFHFDTLIAMGTDITVSDSLDKRLLFDPADKT